MTHSSLVSSGSMCFLYSVMSLVTACTCDSGERVHYGTTICHELPFLFCHKKLEMNLIDWNECDFVP